VIADTSTGFSSPIAIPAAVPVMRPLTTDSAMSPHQDAQSSTPSACSIVHAVVR